MIGCKGPGTTPEEFYDKSLINTDEAGLLWTAGECICGPQLEVGKVILDVVVEGLGKLDEVICATMLSSLDLFVQAAIDFIPATVPIGVAATAARVVQGAKTFVENGVEAASFFGNWVGPACNIPEFHFDIGSVFTNIISSSDGLGASKGCFKKNKADCTKPKPVPAKPDPNPPTNAPNPNPTKPNAKKPDPTSAPAPTSHQQGGFLDGERNHFIQCLSMQDCRRAARKDGLIEGKVGDPMSSTECVNGVNTVHSTITQKPIESYPHEVPVTCSKKWAQACYH
ncbi:hypothetical protein B0T16DRAFT_491216 [Cercophora newfieldiana]|uniref:Uncharacterized protein n=1 Tax=Cercophora newfieldiana TaxID=92897 RepID=A0AA39YAK8_9PEZI|nr:hypothetical protein B0T16DRAFT_491216 [Cercophora newfieldiana]